MKDLNALKKDVIEQLKTAELAAVQLEELKDFIQAIQKEKENERK